MKQLGKRIYIKCYKFIRENIQDIDIIIDFSMEKETK